MDDTDSGIIVNGTSGDIRKFVIPPEILLTIDTAGDIFPSVLHPNPERNAMKLTTLIPTRRNDGSAVSKVEMAAIFEKFWSTFEGCTDEGKTNGVWVHEGTVYRDVCRKLVVNIDNTRYVEAMAVIKEVGRQLGQLAMYVEVQYFDGIQIVPID